MKRILNIISSPRGENAVSTQLSNAIIEKLLLENPGSRVTTKDLSRIPLPHLEAAHLSSFFTPEAARTEHEKAIADASDSSIKELQEADTVVIGLPMYNFGIPSTLKSWLDHIMRAGITFKYDANGPEGLLKNKKIYLAIATGGVYSEGPMMEYDFTEPYLRKSLGFIGLTDISVFRAEGVGLSAGQEAALQKGIDSIVL